MGTRQDDDDGDAFVFVRVMHRKCNDAVHNAGPMRSSRARSAQEPSETCTDVKLNCACFACTSYCSLPIRRTVPVPEKKETRLFFGPFIRSCHKDIQKTFRHVSIDAIDAIGMTFASGPTTSGSVTQTKTSIQ